MEFPKIEYWQKNVIVPGDEKFGRQDFYDYYKTKYEIALKASPKAIAEIGVRWGYSAYSFLCACPAASYTGYDMIAGGHGGVKISTFGYVEKLLKRDFPQSKIELIYADTRTLKSLEGDFDFIHVDGNHTERWAYHDLTIAFAALIPGGQILIDDYTYIDGVRRAVDDFVADNQDEITDTKFTESIRGEFLIIKNK